MIIKVKIIYRLVKATRNGNLWFEKKITMPSIENKKEAISKAENEANNFIFRRCNNQSMIQVKQFTVILSTYHNKTIKNWNYKPTYR